MVRLLRFALQLVLFFVLLGIVIAIATPQTGALEKGALFLVAVGLAWIASRVRQISTQPA